MLIQFQASNSRILNQRFPETIPGLDSAFIFLYIMFCIK